MTPRPRGAQALRERFPEAWALWSRTFGNRDGGGAFTITVYNLNGRVVILQEFGEDRGNSWDVYAPVTDSNEIDKTLDALEIATRRPPLPDAERRAIQSGGALTPQDVLDTDRDNRDDQSRAFGGPQTPDAIDTAAAHLTEAHARAQGMDTEVAEALAGHFPLIATALRLANPEAFTELSELLVETPARTRSLDRSRSRSLGR